MIYSKVPEISKIANRSIFSFLQPAPLLLLTAGSQRRAARRSGPVPATSCFAAASRGAPTNPWTHLPARWSSLPSPRCPGRAPWPPPRRRGGELAAEPQAPNSRAPQHPEDPSILILALISQLPASNTPEHNRSACAEPSTRSASLPRSSRATSHRPNPTGAPPPLIPLHRRTSSSADPLPPTVSSCTEYLYGCGSVTSPFPPRSSSPPASLAAGKGRPSFLCSPLRPRT